MKKKHIFCAIGALAILGGYALVRQAPPRTPAPQAAAARAHEHTAAPATTAPDIKTVAAAETPDVAAAAREDAAAKPAPKAWVMPITTNVTIGEILPNLKEPVADWRNFKPEVLTVALAPDLALDYTMTSSHEEAGRTVWIGRTDAEDGAFIVTVATEDTWYATLSTPVGGKHVEYYISGAIAQKTLKEDAPDYCGTVAGYTLPVDKRELVDSASISTDGAQVAKASDSRGVDVVFFYDAQALALVGNDRTRIKSQAVAGVNFSNGYLANSKVGGFYWRFVEIYQVPAYEPPETSLGDLDLMSDTSSPVGKFVEQRALYHGADEFVLYFGAQKMDAQGWAYCPGNYAVVWQGSSHLTLAHEMAHNFSCEHDRDEPGTGAADGNEAYNYGHCFMATGSSWMYGTIMSYVSGYGGTRIPYFSNPNVLFEGVPTGVQIDQPRAAFNARVLAENATDMANYQDRPNEKPFILTHPGPLLTVSASSSFTLSVVVNTEQVIYQWKKGGKEIRGATESTLTICPARQSDAGRYTVTVSNEKGAMTSHDAIVQVDGEGLGWGPNNETNASGGGAPGIIYLALSAALILFRAATRQSQKRGY